MTRTQNALAGVSDMISDILVLDRCRILSAAASNIWKGLIRRYPQLQEDLKTRA